MILSLAYSPSFAGVSVSVVDDVWGRGHTSQFSKIKQRPPATALSGPKTSAESLTPRRSNLAEADAVVFQPDLFSSATATGSTTSSSALDPPPSRSRPSPVTTSGSGRGMSELDESALSSCPAAPVLSVLRFLPVSRYLTSFFSLENDSLRSSISVSGKHRWWLR